MSTTEVTDIDLHDIRGNTASKERIRDYRRQLVGDMIIARVPIRIMAERLHVSTATIQKDIKVIERWWQESAIKDFNEHVRREVIKLDQLEKSWWERAMWDDSAVDVVLRIMGRRAKLLGLDKPVQAQLEVHTDLDAAKARALELATNELQRRRELHERQQLAASSSDVIDVNGSEATG